MSAILARLRLAVRVLSAYTLALAAGACAEATPVDDGFRVTSAVIRGRAFDEVDQPVYGAIVRVTCIRPLIQCGESVLSGADGRFVAEVGDYRLHSFRADVQLTAVGSFGAAADTLLTGVWVAERADKPDTFDVTVRLRKN